VSAVPRASILKELSKKKSLCKSKIHRLNVCAMQCSFIGGEFERQSIINMTKMVDIGNRTRHSDAA
jgi:putative autoinducer-2 (AI-2) aldolase